LLKKYQAKGLTLIAVPVNQFGGQAPHSSNCERLMLYHKMGTKDFPVLDKVEANGAKAVSFYKFLKAHKKETEGPPAEVAQPPGELGWNYEKFLVDENGQVLGRYASKFDVKDLDSKIQSLLEKSGSTAGSEPQGESKSAASSVLVMRGWALSLAVAALLVLVLTA